MVDGSVWNGEVAGSSPATLTSLVIGGSFNGRTIAFEAIDDGSIPSPSAKLNSV